MKIFILVLVLFSSHVWAKSPAKPELYTCPYGSIEKDDSKPLLLHVTKENLVIGVCGFREKQITDLKEFTVHLFTDKQKTSKPIFSNSSSDKIFFAIETQNGIAFIERQKIGNHYIEVFKHEIVCGKNSCKVQKEVCLALNKEKVNQILKFAKGGKLKSRMKAAGCIK